MTAEQAKRKERTGSDLRLLVPLAGLEPATCCLGDVSGLDPPAKQGACSSLVMKRVP
jgi:hypothetical protein